MKTPGVRVSTKADKPTEKPKASKAKAKSEPTPEVNGEAGKPAAQAKKGTARKAPSSPADASIDKPASRVKVKGSRAQKAANALQTASESAESSEPAVNGTEPASSGPRGPRAKAPDELRSAQVRVLQFLSQGGMFTRKQIAEGAKVDQPFLSTWIGSPDDATRAANDAKRGVKSLITSGYVKWDEHDVDGRNATVYSITQRGRQALTRHEKAAEKVSKAKANPK